MDGRAFLWKRWARQFLAGFEPTKFAGGLSKAPVFDIHLRGIDHVSHSTKRWAAFSAFERPDHDTGAARTRGSHPFGPARGGGWLSGQ
jgi:uncharacterized protein YbjT (DUF2867 family)